MRRAVKWAEDALADLRAPIEYIAMENPVAARRVAARIRSACDTLGEMATGRMGRVAGTYEKVVVGLPYIVAYAIRAEANGAEVIVILCVIHGARNWPSGEWPK
jgi:plasmid stabilization system protein ParE